MGVTYAHGKSSVNSCVFVWLKGRRTGILCFVADRQGGTKNATTHRSRTSCTRARHCGPGARRYEDHQIRADGFVPQRVEIATGDAIRWTNVDNVNHQVVSTNGLFASAVLRPGQTYTRTFNQGGTYRYHDGLKPAERGERA